MRHQALVAALLVALALLPPFAQAEHVYSHRFVFEGRLVGANGLPVPAQLVEFFSEGDTFDEPCAGESQQPITDEWGDFRFCFHKHELHKSTVVGVRVGDIEERKVMDTAFRRTIVLLRDWDATGVAPPEWNETHLVAGKVWQYGPGVFEGVQVYGLALANVPVNVTLETANGRSTYEVETDEFGDFRAKLRLLPNVTAEGARVRVEAMGQTLSAKLSESFHRNTIGIRVPPPPGAQFVDIGSDIDGHMGSDTLAVVANAPGGEAPPLSGGVVLGVIALAGGALWLRLKREK